MTPATVIRLQQAINAAGYGPVAVDGRYGAKTRAAYNAMLSASEIGGVGAALPTPPAPVPWWTSRAVVGGLATLLAALAGLAGLSLDSGQLTTVLTSLVGTISGILTLWGSVRRQAPIDQTLVAPGWRLGPTGLRPEPLPPDGDGPHADRYWSSDRGPLGGPN